MGTERQHPRPNAVQTAILRRLREDPPLSQAALAREAKVKPQQLSEWLNGKRRPQRAQLVKLAVPLRVRVEDLEETGSPRDLVAVPEDVAAVLAELARWADMLAPTAPDAPNMSLLDALERARDCSKRLDG